ncbi:hypothetical protein SAMN06265338_11655 [Rhodoblastus acidophilus]|uniref:Uncharacterized protein n=1 Tax=Rhodoblastus acidophilus TaxID=1074 RepID=A0A212S8T7_RHOAC|nr:hypothetical protein SAMN06265338_11655 [Rhodoblastus acidophilus]
MLRPGLGYEAVNTFITVCEKALGTAPTQCFALG